MPAVWDYLEICFSGANLPATALLILAIMYWLAAILAGLDFEFLDFDFDFDGNADLGEGVGMGAVLLRSLNLGSVPLAIWGSVLALSWWLISMLLDRFLDDPAVREDWFYALQYTVRNLALAVLMTKIVTQPLRGRFEAEEPNPAAKLLGTRCVVSTREVTDRFGQAEYETEAAPLKINVRARGETMLRKGDSALIVDYDAEKNIYFVESEESEV